MISHLSCSLVGQTETIQLKSGSLSHQAYGQTAVVESYCCNYGLNPDYRKNFETGALKVVGENREGAVRLIELSEHPFFIGTLFLPQLQSSPENPHPLITAYVRAAAVA